MKRSSSNPPDRPVHIGIHASERLRHNTGMNAPKVSGLNHLTLAVSDLNRSVAFYRDLLGLRLRAQWDDGAYLDAGSLWLCLSVDDTARTSAHPDYKIGRASCRERVCKYV